MTSPGGDIDRPMATLAQRVQELAQRCHFRSAMEAAVELAMLAKHHRRLLAYLNSSLWVVEAARATLEVQPGVERALEILGLLESVHKARQFQPDVSEEEHSRAARAMTGDAYAHLARLVGLRGGYNSDAFHEVIDEAIEVCRQHDRSDQIARFRQFARDEFLAAGDLEMSLQQARSLPGGPPGASPAEIPWPAAWHIAWVFEVNGQLSDAWLSAIEALRLAPSHDSPLDARLQTWVLAQEVQWLRGQGELLAGTSAVGWGEAPAFPPPGEYPALEVCLAQRDAVAACCQGRLALAEQLLAPWDDHLKQQNAWTPWLEVRLRRIAAAFLAGDAALVASLAGPLEAKAHQGRQWQILARLRGLRDGFIPPAPVPFLARATCGPFALPVEERVPIPGGSGGAAAPTDGQAMQAAISPTQPAGPSAELHVQASPPEAAAAFTPPGTEHTSWAARVAEWKARLRTARDAPEALAAVVDEILAVRPEQLHDAGEAALLLDLADQAAPLARRAVDAWRWAEPLARRFPSSAAVLNLAADLGFAARTEAQGWAERIAPLEYLESLFHRSLELDIEQPRNFSRAGFFYRDIGRPREAERCLARGFRLDRTDAAVVLALAQLYCQTDRPRDALAVLDMSLREGCTCADVARQAGLLSLRLERYGASLHYWRRVEELDPGELWTHYYRAWAHLGLDQPRQALGALDEEEQRFGQPALHLEILRACAAGAMGNLPDFRRHFHQALQRRLAEVDYLSPEEMAQLFEKLYAAAQCLPPEASERPALESLMLAAGLAPDGFFLDQRRKNLPCEGLSFYVFRLKQPLDDRWQTFEGCCAGQQGWLAYLASWGVLAPNAAAAESTVLDWQARCYPLPAEVLDVTLQYENCRDWPGPVWQGRREGIARG